MEDIDKLTLLKFARIVEQLKTQDSKEGIAPENKTIIDEVMNKYKNNPKYSELIDKILEAPPEDTVQMVEEFFNKEKAFPQQEPEEEQIAKVFGISVDQIKHSYLNNGKEVFSFYSTSLGRDIVLENSQKGKSLKEVLQEVQESNEEYQTEDSKANSDSILMDERLKANVELKMYPPSEISQHMDEIQLLTDHEKQLLKYLIQHADELDIKEINIENLIFINNNHELQEIKFDMDFKPIVGDPEGEKTLPTELTEENTMVTEEDELGSMLSDGEATAEDEKKEEKEKDAKKLIYQKPDNLGYIADALFVFEAIGMAIIGVILYFVLR